MGDFFTQTGILPSAFLLRFPRPRVAWDCGAFVSTQTARFLYRLFSLTHCQTHVSCVFVPSDKNKNHPHGWTNFSLGVLCTPVRKFVVIQTALRLFSYTNFGGADGIGCADLAKFADANRHTPVCLFAAVQTHVSCVFVPSDKNKIATRAI